MKLINLVYSKLFEKKRDDECDTTVLCNKCAECMCMRACNYVHSEPRGY